ncbi:MAG: hypothetical protein KatS3mg126_0892 [Lysobacteraceae bacterium]|nr:MAG: hypothetical protein KatS3mg126_0892 [Xanthomonadaceae bacterium]
MGDRKGALWRLAQEALHRAHAPYSGLRVGAAMRAASGALYSGCNVESAAFPIGGCAEHHAIAAGVRAEGPGFRIAEVAIAARDGSGAAVAISPCGACRQLIIEFGAGAVVHFLGADGKVAGHAIADLLPAAFALDAPHAPDDADG